jgi:hypothetical protein
VAGEADVVALGVDQQQRACRLEAGVFVLCSSEATVAVPNKERTHGIGEHPAYVTKLVTAEEVLGMTLDPLTQGLDALASDSGLGVAVAVDEDAMHLRRPGSASAERGTHASKRSTRYCSMAIFLS